MTSTDSSSALRLSSMMFLQFFAWGAWFVTLKLVFITHGLGDFIAGAFGSAPIAAMVAPLFLGLIADRLFASEKVMGVLLLIGSGLMAGIAWLAPGGAANGDTIVWLMIAYMCCFMPTLGLANTITFSHLPQEQFPKVRVWGTIGWIVAGLVVGFAGWSSSLAIFWLAAGATLMLGVMSFTLPSTPPPAKGEPINLRSLLMVDALQLLKKPSFFVFAVCSTLICIPLAYYFGQTSDFLSAAGFKEPGSAMTIGQMSEIVFMLMIPFFFRKLGVKVMLLIGMLSWVARYALFAFGAPNQVTWMLMLGVALHGICYDFFFVTGFMYTDKKASAAVRSQAQSLLVFLTQGVGMFFGYRFAFGGTIPFTDVSLPNQLTLGDRVVGTPPSPELVQAIDQARAGGEAPTVLEQLAGMFGQGYPDGVSPELITSTMIEWRDYWMFPMLLAGGVAILFAITFWDAGSQPEDTRMDDEG